MNLTTRYTLFIALLALPSDVWMATPSSAPDSLLTFFNTNKQTSVQPKATTPASAAPTPTTPGASAAVTTPQQKTATPVQPIQQQSRSPVPTTQAPTTTPVTPVPTPSQAATSTATTASSTPATPVQSPSSQVVTPPPTTAPPAAAAPTPATPAQSPSSQVVTQPPTTAPSSAAPTPAPQPSVSATAAQPATPQLVMPVPSSTPAITPVILPPLATTTPPVAPTPPSTLQPTSKALVTEAVTFEAPDTTPPEQKVLEVVERPLSVVEVAELEQTSAERAATESEHELAAGEIADEVETAHVATPRGDETLVQRAAYLGSYLEPWRDAPHELIEFTFENAELSALISYIEEKFNITFITDDSIKPMPQGGKSILGTKISFKTHAPLTKKDAWDMFVTFLDMAGVAPVPGPTARVYRLIGSKDPKSPLDATRSPLPTFIGVDQSLIPDNDTLIRYVYFVENTTLDSIATIVDAIKSPLSQPVIKFPELNAVIITDRANNIKGMLAILRELDQTSTQEALAIVKLERTDAAKAAQIYADLAKQETAQGVAARFAAGRKSSTTEYFPRGTKVIPEPRTNSLIILGTREAIKTISEFITTMIDRPDDRPEVPRYLYQLKYLDATNTAALLKDVLKFKEDSDAAKSGGVRDGDKYFKPISIVAEPATNTLIINADFEDYSHLHELLQSIDIEQPQIALRLFLLSLDLSSSKELGVQMRNKKPGPNGLIGNNINYQTTGLAGVNSGVVEDTDPGTTGAVRLLGDLVKLAAGAPVGSTVVTLGNDVFGVWGILNMLEAYTKTNVVANPFLVTTNKYKAQFQLGQKRMVVDANIFTTSTQQAFKQLDAVLDIQITPQISRDGLVTLNIFFDLEQFTDTNPDSNNGNRTVKKIETTVIVADNEVLALGGLVRDSVIENVTKVPILGDIPLIGWLFKNRVKFTERTSLLLLIQPEIIYPAAHNRSVQQLTKQRLHDAAAVENKAINLRDPISRNFFNDTRSSADEMINNFMSKRNQYTTEAMEERKLYEARKQEEAQLSDKSPRRRGRKDKKSRPRKTCPPKGCQTQIFDVDEKPRITGATNLLDMLDKEAIVR